MAQSLKTTNRLIHEKSPYLLQHAHNPVDWFPWGEEAFAKAKAENKPIFLSIGYSTCHWCHVMERESFEDSAVADLLNKNFISIKVDREERPDIDTVYMAVCQALTNQGGWPLTILMTPEQIPFFAGTYFPKTARYGAPGLTELLTQAADLWQTKREELTASGQEIVQALKKETSQPGEMTRELLKKGADQFQNRFDGENGGFSPAPKFPCPHQLLFLIGHFLLEQDSSALYMVEKTLTQLYRGGLFDHIGGGFSRYSTDEKFLVPHFEKMLYDNALLAYTYAQAYTITGNPLYRRVTEDTLSYVLRELLDETGGFFCGQDADSDGEEGKYYVFTPQELETVLGPEEARSFCTAFGVTAEGNFEGKSIPNLLNHPDFPLLEQETRQKLLAYRKERTDLHKDDKILTAWNGLMIAALAKAGRSLENNTYTAAAQRTWNFLHTELTDSRGRLLVRFRDGEAAGEGKLEDYAFVLWGLRELYQTTYDAAYLKAALPLAGDMVSRFFDPEQGGFYGYASDGEQLVTRPKESYDGALPSGNSAAAYALQWLAQVTGEPIWAERAHKQLSFLAGEAQEYPAGFAFALTAASEAVYPARQLLCVTTGEFSAAALNHCTEKVPNLTILVKTKANAGILADLAPFTAAYPLPGQGCAYYLCENGACAAPVRDLKALEKLLQ